MYCTGYLPFIPPPSILYPSWLCSVPQGLIYGLQHSSALQHSWPSEFGLDQLLGDTSWRSGGKRREKLKIQIHNSFMGGSGCICLSLEHLPGGPAYLVPSLQLHTFFLLLQALTVFHCCSSFSILAFVIVSFRICLPVCKQPFSLNLLQNLSEFPAFFYTVPQRGFLFILFPLSQQQKLLLVTRSLLPWRWEVRGMIFSAVIISIFQSQEGTVCLHVGWSSFLSAHVSLATVTLGPACSLPFPRSKGFLLPSATGFHSVSRVEVLVTFPQHIRPIFLWGDRAEGPSGASDFLTSAVVLISRHCEGTLSQETCCYPSLFFVSTW